MQTLKLDIYKIKFTLYKFCYHDNVLLSKIKDYSIKNNLDTLSVYADHLPEMLSYTKNLHTVNNFLDLLLNTFDELFIIEFIENDTILFNNFVTNEGAIVHYWEIVECGILFDDSWKTELFNRNIYDPNIKILATTPLEFLPQIEDLLSEEDLYNIYGEKLLLDNPTMYIEFNKK